MFDRLDFKTTRLSNGVTVFSKQMDVPFAMVRVVVPVGSMNNTGSILPGSAHFLEHLVCKQSRRFPEPYSFGLSVGLKGGSKNAHTHGNRTVYDLDIPANSFAETFRDFVAHLASPVITTEGIIQESGTISNERRKTKIWYPGSDKLENHCLLKWKYDYTTTLRQDLGEDSDMACMTPEGLKLLHRAYADPRTYAFVGGTFDLDVVCRELSGFPTNENGLVKEFAQVRWENREYHKVECVESERFWYHLGGIITEGSEDPVMYTGMKFLGIMLVNSVHGVLYNWLRHKLGWVYNINFDYNLACPPEFSDWELAIPLNNLDQVEVVRAELHGRIQDAIKDESLIDRELGRRLASVPFWYQTLGDMMITGMSTHSAFGRIITEKEGHEIIEACATPTFLQHIYETYWSPRVSGEFLAIPEKKK